MEYHLHTRKEMQKVLKFFYQEKKHEIRLEPNTKAPIRKKKQQQAIDNRNTQTTSINTDCGPIVGEMTVI